VVAELSAPRFEDKPAMMLAGLSKRYTAADISTVGMQWFAMQSLLPMAAGTIGGDAFGLWYDLLKGGGEFTYLTASPVGEFSPIHPQFSQARLTPLHYAVFTHQGPATEVRRTVDAALRQWLPNSGRQLSKVEGRPDVIERYSAQYNQTGDGPVEVWLPIEKK
jgi:AraC family transcriptional regulator